MCGTDCSPIELSQLRFTPSGCAPLNILRQFCAFCSLLALKVCLSLSRYLVFPIRPHEHSRVSEPNLIMLSPKKRTLAVPHTNSLRAGGPTAPTVCLAPNAQEAKEPHQYLHPEHHLMKREVTCPGEGKAQVGVFDAKVILQFLCVWFFARQVTTITKRISE